ncbi:MAG: translocation/assembly module TamB domain-containing protein, partial [Balneolales bacterium]
MSENTEQPQLKKRRRWPWITLVVLLVLIVFARLALRSGFVFETVRVQVERLAGENLNGQLSIGSMRGDLWDHVEIHDIRLTGESGQDTLVFMDSVRVDYRILSLLSSPFVVREADIFGLNAFMVQDQDSIWNVEKLLKQDETHDEEAGDSFPLTVERARVHDSHIFVNAPLILPDTSIQIRDVSMVSGFRLFEEGFNFNLDNFAFNLHEGRLAEPIRFETTASGDTTAIQLDRLLVAGGASVFRMMAGYDLDSEEMEGSAIFDPLSWRALRAYAGDAPLRQDITLRLDLEGNPEQYSIRLHANATGMEEFTLGAGFSMRPEPALTHLTLYGQNVDLGVLFDDPEMPSFAGMESSFDGSVAFEDYRNGEVDGFIRLTGLRMDPYAADRLQLNLALRENQVFTNLELNRADEMIFTEAHITDLWGETPEWSADYQIDGVNPALWAGDEDLAGLINARGSLEGRGFEWGNDPVEFHLNLFESSYQHQQVERLQVSGTLNDETVTLDSQIRTVRNLLSLTADADWSAGEPTYRFDITTRDFDLSEYSMEDTLSTSLNLSISGEGRNTEPERMQLDAVMRMDSSTVNGEMIDALTMNISFRDSVLVMDDMELRSRFAEGDLRARYNLLRWEDPGNELEFGFRLLDLRAFAGLAGADMLTASGSVSGHIRTDSFQRSALSVYLDLQDVVYDSLSIENIDGRITATVEQDPDYDVDIELIRPRYGEYAINDVQLQSDGSYINEVLSGNYSFGFIVDDENGLRQRAGFRYGGDSLRVTTRELDLVSEDGNYILQQPFDLVYANERVRVDSLALRGSRTGSVIQLALDQYAPEGFRGFFRGDHVNLGLLQDIILEEKLFDGVLTSHLDFDVNQDRVSFRSQSLMRNFAYEALELDTLHLDLTLADDRLQSNFSIREDRQTLLTSQFNLPFVFADPDDLSDAFFEEPVSGYVEIPTLDLERFAPALTEMGFESMSGLVGLRTTLDGSAGSPAFEGNFILSEAILSDIPVEELLVSWDYDHKASRVILNSHLDTDTQRAFDLNGHLPVYVDFRTFEFTGPAGDDELVVNFTSDDLNLAAFSDFLDPETAQGLTGILNADIAIRGTMENLAMEGFFRVTEGQVRAASNEITFRNISVDVGLEPGKMIVHQASVQSTGTLRGQGEISLDGFSPGDFNLRFNARNFRVFGTRDIEAFIGMDTRLRGSLDEPVLTGNLRLERGTIYFDNFGEREIEEVVLEEDLTEDELLPDEGNQFYENLAMEMNFIITRNVFLRNRSDPEMDLAVEGNLDLVKLQDQDVEIFGDVTIPTGYATTFGKRFDIDSGTIVFSGNPANPQLDIRTIYRPRQQGGTRIEIYYTITGEVEDPEFSYSSDPEMEFQDIISYTLFGRPFNALAGWQQG